MRINTTTFVLNTKINNKNSKGKVFNNFVDKYEPSFSADKKAEKPSLFSRIKTRIETTQKEKYEKSLPHNLTDKQLANAISWHGSEYLDSLKTREDREKFLVLMSKDFDGKPMSGLSQTISAYEANAVITKRIDDIQTYIDLVGHDENYQPLSGLSRILGRYETGEIMQAGVTDYQRYIDLVDKEKDGTSKAGYSRPLTIAEAITVLNEEIEDVEAFIEEQDKIKQ